MWLPNGRPCKTCGSGLAILAKRGVQLENLRERDLAQSDIGIVGTDIRSLYEDFHSVLGGVATAKVLHLICPRVFPAWDTGIAKGFKKEINADPAMAPKLSGEDFSGEHFIRCRGLQAARHHFLQEGDWESAGLRLLFGWK